MKAWNYLSILTNFGCHFQCPYCVTKKQGIDIPPTTVHSLDKLDEAIESTGANIISVSGGGDPLHNYHAHIDFYDRLFCISRRKRLPVEMHTSYIDSAFPYGECYRVVYHLRNVSDILRVKKYHREKVRVVFVVTKEFDQDLVMAIAQFVKTSPDIDELSFRQLIDENYEPSYHLHEFLNEGHKKWWWYIEQGDYNTYFVDGKLSSQFKSLRKEKEN